MKKILLSHGYSEDKTGAPKQIIKPAYSAEMVQDQDGWLNMPDSRNNAVHSYSEIIVKEIVENVK